MRLLLVAVAASVLLAFPSVGAAGEVSAGYIGGTHTVVGILRNVPGTGDVPLSSALAVCQQDVSHPLAPSVRASSPGVGGACAMRLPALAFTGTVKDATFGLLAFEYQGVDAAGEPCAPLGSAASGQIIVLPARCEYLNVWPAATATYGTITLRAA